MNRIADATKLCVGLMSHDPTDPFRQGYGIGSALITAQEQFDLNSHEVAAVADRLVKPLFDASLALLEDGLLDDQPLVFELRDALEAFGVAR